MRTDDKKITFHYLCEAFSFPNRTALKRFIQALIKKEKHQLEALNFIFCTDEYLLQINQQYLNHDTYTDIITFQLNSKHEPIVSDIYISIDRVRENARKFAVPFTTELHRVIFHGALHLCGYKDKSAKDKELMRSKEDHYLEKYFVPRGTK